MPTLFYRFRCTDGQDLVADLRGRRMPTLALVHPHAERVALDLTARLICFVRQGLRRKWSKGAGRGAH
jgi:hypothetical protein